MRSWWFFGIGTVLMLLAGGAIVTAHPGAANQLCIWAYISYGLGVVVYATR